METFTSPTLVEQKNYQATPRRWFLPLAMLLTGCFSLGAQITYTFTNASATGSTGPTQTMINSAYASTNLNGSVTVTGGIQSFTIPASGNYRIFAAGAAGGTQTYGGGYPGGNGATIQGEFTFTVGTVLNILVGQKGENTRVNNQDNAAPGGGGGSFVYINATDATPLVAAGGGAGGGRNSAFRHASAGTSAYSAYTGGAGGTNGNGGGYNYTGWNYYAGGGSGWLTNGTGGAQYTLYSYSPGSDGAMGGRAPRNGGFGGIRYYDGLDEGGDGGFGGGGGGGSDNMGTGGGGGFSGGGGANGDNPGNLTGGGGGSYNGGINQVNTGSVNAGHGYVVITRLSGVNVVQSAQINCNGQTTAVLVASATGGTPPYTYYWAPGGSTSATLSNVGAGTYTCLATDNASQTYTTTYTVTEPPVLSSSVFFQSNVTCNGGSNGAIALTISGGTAPYSYTWSPYGGNSATASGLTAGTYTCTIKDFNNCTITRVVTITQPAPINVVAFATNPVVCSGDPTMLIGAGALTYTWSHGVTNGVNFYPTSTINYTVTGTDNNGCTGKAYSTITVNPKPVIAISGTNVICSGGSANLLASGANSYTWSNSANSNAITVFPTTTTNYSVYGTSAAGCTNVAVKTLSVINSTPVITANTSTPAVCPGKPVTLNGGGAVSYSWTGGVSNNVSFTPAATSSYSVTGYNACGSGMASITITVHTNPVISASSNTPAVCLGKTVTVSGSGGVSYVWSSGVTNNTPFYPINTANYTVTGTDANGCKNTAQVTVTVHSLPFVSANASNSVICSGNSVFLFGGGALTYVWSGGVVNGIPFSPTLTATYNVTGTDGNGCQGTAAKTVSVVTPPVLTANATSTAVCSGSATTLYGGGAASYTWSGGVSNNVAFVPSSSTVYTVTGGNSCGTTTAAISIVVNPLPVVTANASSTLICAGTQATLFGGGANTYSWTGGISNNVPFVPSATSSYTVTGTNANGCRNTAVKTLSVIPLPVITTTANPPLVCAGNTVILSASGAVSYAWSNGVTNNVPFSPSSTGSYTVTGTDANGCSGTAVRTVSVNPHPVVFANANASSICSGNAVVLYGSGAHTYTWSNGVTNGSSFFPSTTTTYSVSGTNTLTGCTSTNNANVTVTVNALPAITASASNPAPCQGMSTILYGGGGHTYSWSGGVSNGWSFIPSTTTSYYVTGTNTITGCVNIAMITVTVNPKPVITASASATSVCAGNTVALYGMGAHTYTWTNGVANGVPFSPTNSIYYYANGTNTLTGCVSSNYASIIIYVNQAPNVSIVTSTTAVCEGNPVTLYASGANTYTWSHGVVAGVPFVPLATTTYTLDGTNTGTGCSKTATRTVFVYPLPTVTAVASKSAVCQGMPVSITAQGANSYTFSPGVIFGVPFTPSATKTYTVSGSNLSTGCRSANAASVTVIVNPLPVVTASISTNAVCYGNTVMVNASGAGTYTWSGGVSNGVPFTPFFAGSYTVSGTDTITGCKSANSAVVGVSIVPLPVISSSISTNEICIGNTVTVNASGAHVYNWSGGLQNNVPFSPTASAVYTVSGTNTITGCSDTSPVAHTLTVKSLPVITITQPQPVICVGESADLAAQGALTYTWSTANNTASMQVTPTVTTVYTVTGTSSGGCLGSAVITQSVSECTGVSESQVAQTMFVLYPNPNSGRFVISSEAAAGLKMYNELGQLVKLIDIDAAGEHEVLVPELANGVYYIVGSYQGQAIRQKVIVNK